MKRRDVFDEAKIFKTYEVNGNKFNIPIRYRRVDTYLALYTANIKVIKDMLPSKRLKPLRFINGKGMVCFNAFNYIENDLGQYGELSISFPCICFHNKKLYTGIYIHSLPVSTDLACAAGRHVWGFPKFTCDMEHENSPLYQGITLKDNDDLIMNFRVKKRGYGFSVARDFNTFTILNDEIIFAQTFMQHTMRVGVGGDVQMDLGNHQMARDIEKLEIGRKPLISGDLQDNFALLRGGISLGRI